MHTQPTAGLSPSGLHHVYLGLGSNLGDRRAQLQAALDQMAPWLTVQAVSAVYATAPWGVVDQPDFLNICLRGTTALAPQALLARTQALEQALGRRPTRRWGPRAIDIDILLYDALVLAEPHLSIPHPRLAERSFVLIPLAELAPDLLHPVSGLSIAELAARCGDHGVMRQPDPLIWTP